MSPYAEAYLTGAYSLRGSRLIYIPRNQEYLTQQTFARLISALRNPITISNYAGKPCV